MPLRDGLDRFRQRVKEKLFRLPQQGRKIFYGLPTIQLADLLPQPVTLEPPILDRVCLPPYMGTSRYDDLSTLLRIVKAIEPRIVIELGTAHGNITANICRQSPHARVLTVNAPVEQQTGELVTYNLTREEIGSVYRAHGFSERVIQIFDNTLHLDLSAYLAPASAELAIIDACHDTDYVLNDFFKVIEFVARGGLVLFHDTHPSMKMHLAGSYVACMKLRQQGYDIHHIANSWWAVWRKE